jgi:integrase/recombinase XerD
MTPAGEGARPAFRSPLGPQLEQFLALKRAMGYRYREEARLVGDLDQFLTSRLAIADPVLTLDLARDYVARRGTESDSTRAHRLTIVREVGRFLRLEDARTAVPGPRFLGILRRTSVPRVLSREEGRRFLHACDRLPPDRRSPIRGVVLGTALRVLYLTGLRLGELRRLTHADVDLDTGVLRIHHTKFGKSRLVPVAPDLVTRLAHCQDVVRDRLGVCPSATPFFPHWTGRRYSASAVREALQQTLDIAGIPRVRGGRRLRLHDLRHSWAVLRLTLWCEQDADLGAKLPLLATYLGHVALASSQRYLQLTQDLVVEVTRRHHARFGHVISDGRTS